MRRSSSRLTSSSRRARGAPTQKWMPPPNPTWVASPRPASKRSGSVELLRVAVRAPKSIATSSPTASGCPAISTPSLEHPAFEQLQRRVPPDHLLDGRPGRHLARRTPSATRSGCFRNARIPLPSVFTVASWPALSRTMVVQTISSSVSRSPASSTSISCETRPASGARRLAAMSASHVVDEGAGRFVGRHALLVGGRELVHLDDGVGPRQQVDRCRREARRAWRTMTATRVGLREVGQQVEARPAGELGEARLGLVLDRRPQRCDRPRREHLADQPSQAGVIRGFQVQQRPPLAARGRPPIEGRARGGRGPGRCSGAGRPGRAGDPAACCGRASGG